MKGTLSLIVAAATVLSGCSGGRPPSAGSAAVTSAAYYDYVLPETSAKISLQIAVTGCDPSATFKLEPVVTVAAVRGPDHYRLVGGDLSSWFKSHDLSLTSWDSGALKSLNSADADKTFSVITNVIKGVVSLAAIAGSSNPTGITCSPQTKSALANLKALKDHREQLAKSLATSTAAYATGLAAAITATDAEIGRLATSESLRFELPAKDVDLLHAGGEVAWDDDDLPTILTAAAGDAKKFSIAFCVAEQGAAEPEAKCSLNDAAKGKTVGMGVERPPRSCGSDANCSRTIVMREPVRAVLTFVGSGQAFDKRRGKAVKSVALPIAQWGTISMLSTNVGLAKSRAVGFGLDEYGGRNSFTWKSDARADSLTGGAATALDAGATLTGKIRDADLTADKAELDRLDTGQKLAKARACQAILDSGGTCPKE